MEGAYWNRS